MKTSELLKRAKRDHLASSQKEYDTTGKSCFLCLAIADAGYITDQRRLADKLQRRITKALGAHTSVGTWLMANGHARAGEFNAGNASFEYRHRWIDSLIAEYEAKGD